MKAYAYIGLVMGTIMVGMAVILVVYPPSDIKFLQDNDTIRYLLAVCVLFYGLFRLYRSVRMIQGKNDGI